MPSSTVRFYSCLALQWYSLLGWGVAALGYIISHIVPYYYCTQDNNEVTPFEINSHTETLGAGFWNQFS